MSTLDEVRVAQRNAGEDAAIASLQRMGLVDAPKRDDRVRFTWRIEAANGHTTKGGWECDKAVADQFVAAIDQIAKDTP